MLREWLEHVDVTEALEEENKKHSKSAEALNLLRPLPQLGHRASPTNLVLKEGER
jgi:hypothetical protein